VKKELKLFLSFLSTLCWGILFLRSWVRAANYGHYFMTVLWGLVLLVSIFSLILNLRMNKGCEARVWRPARQPVWRPALLSEVLFSLDVTCDASHDAFND